MNEHKTRLKLLLADCAVLIVTIIVLVLIAKKGWCLWCYSDVCLTQAECGPDCVCVVVGTQMGTCIGIDDGEEDEEWERR